MGVADDLTSLFPAPAAGAQLGQGTILTWDSATGHNTVDWAGTTLTDVPILNTAEAITLKPGHVVVLLGQGGSWFIIGRVTTPGDPDFAGASVAFSALNDQATNFALSTSLVTKSSVLLNVPAWADEAAIFVVGACTVVNPNGAADFAACSAFIDGNPGAGVQTGVANGPTNTTDQHVQSMAVSMARVQPVTGGSTVLCELKIRSTAAAWSAQSANIAEVSAMAIFRSNT
jgi:hypothetical protein